MRAPARRGSRYTLGVLERKARSLPRLLRGVLLFVGLLGGLLLVRNVILPALGVPT